MSNESNGLHHLRFREKEKKGEEKKEKKKQGNAAKNIYFYNLCMHACVKCGLQAKAINPKKPVKLPPISSNFPLTQSYTDVKIRSVIYFFILDLHKK